MFKIVINPGHSSVRFGAEDGINAAEKDYRWTREESDNNRLAGIVIRELYLDLRLEIKIMQQSGYEKLSDLCNRIEKYAPDVLIALHRNAVSNPQAKGWSLWYHEPSREGKGLAISIANHLRKLPNIQEDRGGGVRSDYERFPGSGFAVLRTVPKGILFEGGFITNPIDEIWYDSATILVIIAEAIGRGMKDQI